MDVYGFLGVYGCIWVPMGVYEFLGVFGYCNEFENSREVIFTKLVRVLDLGW